jgi:hypothetical protein
LKVVQRADGTGKLCDYIYFAAEDTGIGMSPDYLKSELFTPFSQENSLSPGIGLGLSIVQQLVSGLEGNVEVNSTVGGGTCVEVLLPLASPPRLAPDSEHSHAADSLRGLRLCLIMAESSTSLTSSALKSVSEIQPRAAVLESALRQIAGEVLGMDMIVATRNYPIPEADLYFVDAGVFDDVERTHIGPLESLCGLRLVIRCSSAGSPHCLGLKTQNSVHLHHSIEPKTLASALSAALRATQHRNYQQNLNTLPRASPAVPIRVKRSETEWNSTSSHFPGKSLKCWSRQSKIINRLRTIP